MLALPTGLSDDLYSGRYDAWFLWALIANFVINGTYAARSLVFMRHWLFTNDSAYPRSPMSIFHYFGGTAIGAAGSYISLRKFLKV
ncbi:MAG: hypothetical protein ACLRXQ_10820 [Phascolarctobacterium faecium]